MCNGHSVILCILNDSKWLTSKKDVVAVSKINLYKSNLICKLSYASI